MSSSGNEVTGFSPPPYPYDRLAPLKQIADEHDGGVIDLSVGDPKDPPPEFVMEALSKSHTGGNYPPSVGFAKYREAASDWMRRRFSIDIAPDAVGACIGTKEFVSSAPYLLKLRRPEKDTVLYPAVSYPTYQMGAMLAGCRAVPVSMDKNWCIDLQTVNPQDAARAVCLWINTPGNPAGNLDALSVAADWGKRNDVPVLSDECYAEFTWDGHPRSILSSGSQGVLAVHSLSKRSNLAGLRAGFYAGDPELVFYLSEVRKHQGLLMAGPVQEAATLALADDDHVNMQRERYRERLRYLSETLNRAGIDNEVPGGGFYLWVASPKGTGWDFAQWLATHAGALVSPGEMYGMQGADYVRIAVVQPMDRLELLATRLTSATRNGENR